MNTIKNLGEYKYSEIVDTGIDAPYSGNYTITFELLGHQHSIVVALIAGDDVTFTNGLNEVAEIVFKVEIPTGNQVNGIYYLTTDRGEILFKYKNVLTF
jgi:hypothetical protein